MSPFQTAVAVIRVAKPRLATLLLLPYVVGTELSGLSGSRSEPLSFGRDHLSEYRSELLACLAAFRRRLWLCRSLVLFFRTLLLAALALLLFAFLDIAGFAAKPWWHDHVLGLMLATGLAIIFLQRLTYFDVARVVDRQLGLKALLGTAVQLTVEGEPNQIARSQVRQATTIARRLEASQAITLRMPWRDLRLLAVVAASVTTVSLLASLGLRAPVADPAVSYSMEALDPSLYSWYEIDPAMAAGFGPEETRATGLQRLIEDLKRRLNAKEITPAEYASQVAAAEDRLRQQVEESSRQQAALMELAYALSDTSTTRRVAENLYRGDFAQAVQELADLSANADRLSGQAREELAERLSEAARHTSGTNPELSSAAERAAQALRQGDTGAAQEALRDLANAMAEASRAVAPNADLGEALQQLEGYEFGDLGLGEGELYGAPGSSDQAGQPGEQHPGDGADQGEQGGGRSTRSAQGSGSEKGSGAGSGRGERVITRGPEGQTTRPELSGNVLRISGKPGSGGSSVLSEAPGNAPLTSASTGTSSIQPGGAVRSDEPVNAIGESNYVPLELRPVVKDYFSRTERP